MTKHHFRIIPTHHKRHALAARAPSDSCSTGGFYTAPKIGDSIDAMKPLAVSWDPSCIEAKNIDIYLFAPGSANSRIHVWQGVSNSRGSFTLDLLPRWWNSLPKANLQIQIVASGTPTFSSALPAGPVFEAVYTAPSDGSVPAEADTNKVNVPTTAVNDGSQKSGGKTAAAVLVPLLFIALLVGAYFKWKRSKGLDKRKKWTEAVDKRMSTISGDWKSVSAAGAQAAIRNSMAVGNRASSFSFGGGVRPSSTFDPSPLTPAEMAQRKPGIGLRNPSAMHSTDTVSRVSRVSFANDPRPSVESRRTKAFRDSYVPPVPTLPAASKDDEYDEKSSNEGGEGALSPTQTQGAMSLTPEAIRARIAAGRARSGSNAVSAEKDGGMDAYDEVMPALSLMRTGHAGTNSSTDDLLFSAPTQPAPTYPKPINTTTAPLSPTATGITSPIMATMPMQPASVMSPDDMLRAYAERKKSGSHMMGGAISTSAISYPMPVVNKSERMLFNGATGVVSPQGTGEQVDSKPRTPSLGFAPDEYDPNFVFGQQQQQGGDVYGYNNTQQQYAGYDQQAYAADGNVGVGAYGGAAYVVGDADEDDVQPAAGNFAGRGVYRS